MSNIIEELKKYIENSKAVAASCDGILEQMILQENYVQAEGYKVAKCLHESTAYHLQRIVDGLPAFEESPPQVGII